MLRSLIWRFSVYVGVSLVAILLLVPTMITDLPQWWSKILPDEKVRLGLGAAYRCRR